jgi:hypothetical protein
MMKRITGSLLLLLLVQWYANAQTKGFAWHARLDTVKAAGFYTIEITHPVNAHTKTDFSDIRIVNDSGKWVPHLLRLPASEITDEAVLMEMPFERREVSAALVTCVVKNSSAELSAIELLLRNTTAQRVCSISGSFDGSNWFIINDSIMLQAVVVTDGDKTKCRISFPPSSYPYIKVVIDSKKTDPVNIISISAQTTAYNPGRKFYQREMENPNCTITQKDSAKTSYIRVTQGEAYQFERISLLVSGVKFFNRRVDMYVPQGNNHSFANPGRLCQSFIISNNSTLQFVLPHVKATIFYLLVHNDDNLPLTVTSVKTALQYRVLTAYLEKGNYQLLTGNEKIAAPVYDLAQLNTKLPDSIAILGMRQLMQQKSDMEEPIIAPKKDSRIFLWGAIILILLALLYFTVKLTREVNKSKATANDSTV